MTGSILTWSNVFHFLSAAVRQDLGWRDLGIVGIETLALEERAGQAVAERKDAECRDHICRWVIHDGSPGEALPRCTLDPGRCGAECRERPNEVSSGRKSGVNGAPGALLQRGQGMVFSPISVAGYGLRTETGRPGQGAGEQADLAPVRVLPHFAWIRLITLEPAPPRDPV